MTLPKWLRALVFYRTELPCGCVVTDAGSARLSDKVAELERERETVGVKRYENATVYDNEWFVRYECEQCGATWTDRRSAGRRTDYGERNPGVGVRLETRHRPGPFGGAWRHEDVPVVEGGDEA